MTQLITGQASWFLNVEAQVNEDKEMLDEEEDSESMGPSRYSQAIHNIAQWYRHSSAELDEGKSDADEDENKDLAILNTAGIWEKI
ncbi:hypothetical protein BDN67DRAFT_1017497 [Paxillus ammoniavirescens]|nr:hypothetical protein BDN67DRAFT_1017497 [Paxillus ammoniavirescens]